MRFKLIVLISIALLSGCDHNTAPNKVLQLSLTGDLEDCKGYSVLNSTVIRCPNSDTTTSYKSGKTRHNITLVENSANPVEVKPNETKQPEPEEKVILMDGKKYKITEL